MPDDLARHVFRGSAAGVTADQKEQNSNVMIVLELDDDIDVTIVDLTAAYIR